MVNIIIHSGTKKQRLDERKRTLASMMNKDMRKPQGPKGSVYDFAEWKGEKKKGYGKWTNKSLVNEVHDIHKDLEKK